ncbi:uncharacterized protein LOC116212405 [Punica granatum]|uniref:Uncharacterized protein n=2 Tax=Punica granatum TaxID=22663 RepID=A0A218WSS8_PUNGR|nr:uncharacterized protein LOC116212405 [Punica granatum]OWM75845.1 hypothetical protein CDL15_Pgr009489 [Punica granatum]PKI53148.1 hypothetical protein CRG98_026453 [Punica granatum]
MRDRGKAVDVYSNAGDGDPFVDYYNYDDGDGSSGPPCRKHPGASSVGICAFCLKDRLVKLVCSDCGEQRLSSCSCSDDLSSNRNSCTVEVGSVGRISFLIDNEKGQGGAGELPCPNQSANGKARVGDKPPPPQPDRVVLLKRSSSSCVEIKKTNGIWKIGRLFRKKKQKGLPDNNDSKSEMWVVDDGNMGGGAASRSRSLNSFRGCGVFGSEDGDWTFSGARSSISGARPSSVLDPDRKSGFSEAEPRRSAFSEAEPRRSAFSEAEPRRSGLSETFTEPRKSGAVPEDPEVAGYNNKPTRRIFSLRESDFSGVDEKGFIDLKFISSSEAKASEPPSTGAKMGLLASSKSAFGSMRSVDGFIGEGDFSSGSCRITVTDRGLKKSRRSFKGWRWVFRQYHPSWTRSSSKKKDNQDLVGVN